VSPRTVQQHTLHIYGKLGVSTRAAATLVAAEHRLLMG
jgi:DNA-binding CsgD family transcriptional regulator